MEKYRIQQHPILEIPTRDSFTFYWKNQPLQAKQGETISAALFANGIRIFGHHPKDQSPLGIFCANGQCAQCMVLADGKPLKSCMVIVQPEMRIEPSNGNPILPLVNSPPQMAEVPLISTDVLIIGGGPAGLSAAGELGRRGISVILVDDKHRLGGKLVLQTHRFFGSSDAVYGGTRGIDISDRLAEQINQYPSVEVWLNSTAVAVFSDHKVGLLQNGHHYVLIQPKALLIACGAREKFLAFKGNSLPGVYGAGAFQTLVNRDLVRPAEKLFIVGGGNVGLIAGYHALQAGIQVVGLVEALPECGGYKVHKDKLVRMGVPVHTSHTILSANGSQVVESVTIAQVNEDFKPVAGSERSYTCDSVLIAVGLDPVNELYLKAKEFGLPSFVAGDAEEIAEASAAIFSGKIRGFEIACFLGSETQAVPADWYTTCEILKSRPGKNFSEVLPEMNIGIGPILHCTQEIPCDPCVTLCPLDLIHIDNQDIRQIPVYVGDNHKCKGCNLCVVGCPGLAITLVNARNDPEYSFVSIPYEFSRASITTGDLVKVVDTQGENLGQVPVVSVNSIANSDRTLIVRVKAPKAFAVRIAGIEIQDNEDTLPLDEYVTHIEDDTIICRCERVTAFEIRDLIRQGYRDINEIKSVTRAGMGSCGSKTCNNLIHRIFREEKVSTGEVTDHTRRPLFIEVPLGIFAGVQRKSSEPS